MKDSELPELLKEKEELLKRVTQIDEIVIHLEAKNEQKVVSKRQKAIEMVKNSYDPSFYIGQEVEGIKITKKLLKEVTG